MMEIENYDMYNSIRGDQLIEEMAFWLEYLGQGNDKAQKRLKSLLDAMSIDEEQWIYNYDLLKYVHVKEPMSYANMTKD